ncbi:hypothetical protein K431DRAFT_308558 [Polychaeton citri CBS 116435]|uniref:Ubiquitin 3 binding protein But2 C-terminal domain-containing protein n=1 Tax=Polychaeton citri CBS 116435 TaxID=1314669 RepID=A0A9P4UTH6_9PEZI|nr:hypothetical protein K431DRAFT_308558 [Polychaeton citri CBS 116435]
MRLHHIIAASCLYIAANALPTAITHTIIGTPAPSVLAGLSSNSEPEISSLTKTITGTPFQVTSLPVAEPTRASALSSQAASDGHNGTMFSITNSLTMHTASVSSRPGNSLTSTLPSTISNETSTLHKTTKASVNPSVATSPSTSSATSKPTGGFQVTNMRLRIGPGDNTTLHFEVHDPTPQTNASGYCESVWNTTAENFPEDAYKPCGKSGFAWNLDNYRGLTGFNLNIEHGYEDPRFGEPPNDYIFTFGSAEVDTSDTFCGEVQGVFSCDQEPGIIYAPITKVSSKRSVRGADI